MVPNASACAEHFESRIQTVAGTCAFCGAQRSEELAQLFFVKQLITRT